VNVVNIKVFVGNEVMDKGFAGELIYGQAGRWGIKVLSSGSLGNEGMLKGAAG